MNKRKYSAFTLVEMLIVMGILSILMAIGVSVARFAVQRANNIQHQSAVDQIFQAMQSYYTDNRKYPVMADFVGYDAAINGGVLSTYIEGSFDGGSAARYYYFPATGSNSPQSFLTCVSFEEPDAVGNLAYGGYCNGNGFGVSDVASGSVTNKSIEADCTGSSDPNCLDMGDIEDIVSTSGCSSDWEDGTFSDNGCAGAS